MTPTHSGIDFGWAAGPAFRRSLCAVVAVAVVSVGAALLLIAPVSSTACESLAHATRGPDLRVTALPGVDLRPLLALPGLTAASGPYPGVASSMQRGGTEISTWIEARPAHNSAVDRAVLVSGSWARPGGVVVEQGVARRLGLRTGRRVRVATAAGPLGLRVAGVAATSSVARSRGISGLAYVLPRDLRRVAPAPVRSSTVLLRMQGHDSAGQAESLARSYPGPQALITRRFSSRCVPR